MLSSLGWRYGLQSLAALVFVTFILGTFYRSATMYHPQRRAILHLKVGIKHEFCIPDVLVWLLLSQS